MTQSPTHTSMTPHSNHYLTSLPPVQATGTRVYHPRQRTEETGASISDWLRSHGGAPGEPISEGKPTNQRTTELQNSLAASDGASARLRGGGESNTSSVASSSSATRANTLTGDPGLLKKWYPLFNFVKSRDETAQIAASTSQDARFPSLRKEIQDVKTQGLRETDTVIAVMGPTGSGKSSFISTVAGIDRGVGHGLESCTSEISVVRVRVPTSEGDVEVVLVDTPGFDDTHKSDYQILQLISEWLKEAGYKNILLDGILYLHRISGNRMAGTPLKNLQLFEKICGPQACSRVVMVTTMWDELRNEEQGNRREGELKSKFWAPMIERGSSTERYRNTEESAWHILGRFVDTPKKQLAAVQLQKETVKHNRELPRTDAGQELFDRLEELDKERKSLMRTLKKQINRSGTDEDVVKLLQDQYRGLEREHEATMRELGELKISVPQRFLKSLSIKARYLASCS